MIFYCIKCKRDRKSKNSETSHLSYKTLVIFIICSKCGSKRKKLFKEEESIETLKITGWLKIKNMVGKNTSLDFRLRWNKKLFFRRNKT